MQALVEHAVARVLAEARHDDAVLGVGRRIVGQGERVVAVDEQEPRLHAVAGHEVGLVHGPPPVAGGELLVLEARPHGEAQQAERQEARRLGAHGEPPRRQVRERRGHERVLERQDVGEHARAAAWVAPVEVERRVRDDVAQHDERRDPRGAGASPERGDERPERQQEEGLGVERVECMCMQASRRRAERRPEPVASGAHAGEHEVAVLVQAPDARAEAPPVAVLGPVADGVVEVLR